MSRALPSSTSSLLWFVPKPLASCFVVKSSSSSAFSSCHSHHLVGETHELRNMNAETLVADAILDFVEQRDLALARVALAGRSSLCGP